MLEQATAIDDVTARMMAAQLAHLGAAHGPAFRWAGIADTVWHMRDMAGRHAGVVQSTMVAGKPMALDQRLALAAMEGQVNQSWRQLVGLLNLPDTPVAVRDGLLTIRSAYFENFAAEWRRLQPFLATGDYPYSGTHYRDMVLPIGCR